ncbi:MAG: aminotransferase [Rhodocyclaceae bacterium]|nr:aminotransferase [Rhodocyclaceae bacterium]
MNPPSGTLPGAAARMADIAPFHVMELLTRARQLEAAGRSIIHMEVGEPDFPTPQPIIEAATAFIRSGNVHYTPALGIPQLREAIARFYAERHGVDVPPECIAITAGASGALLLALGVLLDPGDELLLTDPGYPCNRHFVRTLEGVPRAIAVGPETNYQPVPAQVEEHWTPRSKGLLVASPANPTGTMLEAAELDALSQCTSRLGGRLIVDEIYHGLTYGSNATTALAFSEEVFVVNSFSKYFGMTGWRLGWLVVPQGFVREVEKLAQNLFISASTPAQYAALAAFEPATIGILEERRLEFQARRDFLLPAIRQLGFHVAAEPRGAFYLYADSSALAADSFRLTRELIEEAGVAITPGLDFGGNAPERHVRFACTVARNRLEEGMARIARHLGR